MKKLIFIFLICFSGLIAAAQTYPTPYQNLGSINILVRDTGGLAVRQTFIMPVYSDTGAANAVGYPKNYKGSMIFTTSDSKVWVRNNAFSKWNDIGGTAAIPTLNQVVYAGNDLDSSINTIEGVEIGDLSSTYGGSKLGIGYQIEGDDDYAYISAEGTKIYKLTDGGFIYKTTTSDTLMRLYGTSEGTGTLGKIRLPKYPNTDSTYFLTTNSAGEVRLSAVGGGSTPSLQDVTDVGSTTTNAITVIKDVDNIALAVNGTDTQTKLDMGNSADNGGYLNLHNSADAETIGLDGESGNITAKNATLNNLASGASTDSIVTITSAGVIRKRNASVFSGTDSASYHTVTQVTDSSFSLNRPNGTSDTIVIAGTDTTSLSDRINQKLDSIRLVNSGVLFTSPAAFVKNNTTGVVTQTLATQSAYTNFGNNTASSTTPVFFTNNFSDSLKRSNDSIYRRVNGVFIYQYKDSVGGGSSGWALTGNAITAGQFLGTTNNTSLRLHSNGVLRILADSVGKVFIDSIYVGRGIGVKYNNIAIGDSTLQRNTTGNGNTAIGDSALQLNTSGFDNTAIGKKALRAVTANGGNTAVGSDAGLTLTSTANTAIGNGALKASAGNFNTAIGFSALTVNTAAQNTAVGANALVANTSGASNVAVGYGTLAANTTSSANTGVGMQSLPYATGGNNTGIGAGAGSNVSTGGGNTFVGSNTGNGITTGNYNTILGSQSGNFPASRSNYVIIQDGQGNNAFWKDSIGRAGIGTTTPNSTLSVGGSFSAAYVAKTANYTATINDYFIDCTSNSFTITLPTAVGITGRMYIIKNSGTATVITIATTSSETIDGTTPPTITTLTPLRIISDGANWKTF